MAVGNGHCLLGEKQGSDVLEGVSRKFFIFEMGFILDLCGWVINPVMDDREGQALSPPL